ncbi:MAG: DUF4236 domain-containing protein [Acidimicrobiales bacterium]
MPFTFRRSKKLGPLRLTVGKRGLSASTGVGPLRRGWSSAGRRSWSLRLPFGLGWRKSSTR